jgi:hypothetical protein
MSVVPTGPRADCIVAVAMLFGGFCIVASGSVTT